ncbi:hypothetical protein FRX31_009676 [Thalictrum thalictroides]|uniref:Uncharacterized protein n=1 Tax=Thalictrum thalictroides TaxID=46969 RepID=A0A7J6WV01_THATH|nr:hypothetical protein FRX31_009676 [Thalictrum thalictroides]
MLLRSMTLSYRIQETKGKLKIKQASQRNIRRRKRTKRRQWIWISGKFDIAFFIEIMETPENILPGKHEKYY